MDKSLGQKGYYLRLLSCAFAEGMQWFVSSSQKDKFLFQVCQPSWPAESAGDLNQDQASFHPHKRQQ